MVNYTDNPTDVEEIRKDRIRWIIKSLKAAIKRFPYSEFTKFRQDKIDELEKKL